MPKIQNSKEQKKDILMRKMSISKKARAIILLDLRDESVKIFLRDACRMLDIALIESYSSEDIFGSDACISDGLWVLDLVSLMKESVVPIVPKAHALIASLHEFDPMKFEGNAFIYESVNPYLIFEKLVRYLENIRYAGDRRTLIANVEKTF